MQNNKKVVRNHNFFIMYKYFNIFSMNIYNIVKKVFEK